ncbi:MAG: hypothetical protein V3U27_17290 [Candidatus Tectomicrobia bacterium]
MARLRFSHICLVCLLLLLWLRTSLLSAAPPSYYTLSDFQWYVRHADGSKQRTELLSQLSRQDIVVGIIWSDTAERNRKLQALHAFLQQPEAVLPAMRQVKAGPSGNHFATYVLTLAADRSLAGIAVLLNTMQSLQSLDFALPVFELSHGAATPFIEFTAVLAADAEAQTIESFLRRQPVTVLSKNGTVYTLRLRTRAITNILIVIRAFEEASPLVEDVRPIWLDPTVSQPVTPVPSGSQNVPLPAVVTSAPPPGIEAHVSLDTGWGLPLVNVRQAVTYRLLIERTAQFQVVPESIAPAALRRALVRSTALPAELFDITEAGKHTTSLADKRVQDIFEYTLRFSKPGTYHIPTLSITYTLPESRRNPRTLHSSPLHGYMLGVDAHLPGNTHALPGDILAPPPWLRRPWPWLRPLTLGLVVGGVLALGIGRWLAKPPRRHVRKEKRLSSQQLQRQYQSELQQLRDRMPAPTDSLALEERLWLRQCAALLRRLIGAWWCDDATLFEGGAGVSAAMITVHLELSPTAQERWLEPALQLLQELDAVAAARSHALTSGDYDQFCQAVEQTIQLLTTNEASHVLCASTRL